MMSWQSLGLFQVKSDWVLTPSVTSNIFRVSHVFTNVDTYLKAVIAKAFRDDRGLNIFHPQRLTSREEKEIFIFYFSDEIATPSLAFKRLDNSSVKWFIEIEMFFSSSSKQQTTYAQPVADINVNTQKTVIIPERTDGERHSYLISNTAGSHTVFFKYVPLGTDPNTVTVSATSYDFLLTANEKFLDSNSSRNAVVGICAAVTSGANARIKVTEYFYS